MLVIRVPACTLSQAALPTLHAFVALFESVPPLYGPEQALVSAPSNRGQEADILLRRS